MTRTRKIIFAITGSWIALALSLPHSYAEAPEADAVRTTTDAPKAIESILNPQPKQCATPSSPGEADPCVDLFKASCVKPDGSFKNEFKLEDEMDKKIHAALGAAQKQMGSASIEGDYLDLLKKNNYAVTPNLDEEKKKKLMSGNLDGEISDYFSNFPKDCNSIVALTPEQDVQATQLLSKALDNDSIVSSTKQRLKYAQSQFDSLAEQRKSGSGAAREYAQSEMARIAKSMTEDEKLLETQKKEMNEAWTKRDAIYSEPIAKAKEALAEFRKRASESYAKDYPGLVSAIMRFCTDDLKSAIDSKTKEAKEEEKKIEAEKAANSGTASYIGRKINEEISKFAVPPECSKDRMYTLRDQAVQLFRIKDPSRHEKAVKEFVDKYFPFYLSLSQLQDKVFNTTIWSYASSNSNASAPQPEARHNPGEDLLALAPDIKLACSTMKSAAWSEVRTVHEKFYGNIARSKATVESMLDATYGPEQKARMTELYNRAHDGIMTFIEKDLALLPGLKGTDKLKRITESTAKLTFSWTAKPAENLYKKEPDFPLPVLDFDKVPETEMMLWIFQDSSLNVFKEMNAEYTPQMKVGALEMPETVILLPSVNLMVEKDPYATLAVIAHEIGHKIGYKTSVWNGYDLTQVYAKLVECLSTEGSIKLEKGQEDEAMADWISSKVMGRILMALPPDQRKPAALRLAGFFCQAYGVDGFYKSPLGLKEGHPETSLRINGIFGANSGVRQALGCSDSDSKCRFVECTLEGAKP